MFHYVAVVTCLIACKTVEGASLGSIAQDVHSDQVFLNANLAASLPNLPKDSHRLNIDRFGISPGGALDLFYRFGFFSLSVRVVPRDDPGSWLVREPTMKIFEPSTINKIETVGPNSFAQQPFEISLCDDLTELKEAYFKSFTAEGVAQPHKLYTGSWRTPTMAKYLGISVDVLKDDAAYVLIKLIKNSGTVEINPNRLRLGSEAAQAGSNIRAGDEQSVMDFVQNYGSHFIRSVTVGDSIYQVLALTNEQMDKLKSAVNGRRQLTVADWENLYNDFLAPWHVRETGEVRVASGDVQLQRFAEEKLRFNAQFGSYPNLVGGLINNPDNIRELESLGRDTTAVVSVDLAALKSFVGNGDIQTRQFYDEIVDSKAALWEVNL